MATPNLARFTINGTPSEDTDGKRGFDATPGQVLTLTLERNPAAGALTAKFELPNRSDPSAPLSSLYDTQQLFTEGGLSSITLGGVNDAAHVTVNASTDVSSYVVRCTVATESGPQVFERLVVVRKSGLRMSVPAERSEYAPPGWSDAMNELTKAVADGGVTVPTVSAAHVGTVAAFPTGVPRVFTSDGSTPGGVWVVGSFLPAGTEGYTAYYTGGVWETAPLPSAGTTIPTPTYTGQTPYWSQGSAQWKLSGAPPYGGVQWFDNVAGQVKWEGLAPAGFVWTSNGTRPTWAPAPSSLPAALYSGQTAYYYAPDHTWHVTDAPANGAVPWFSAIDETTRWTATGGEGTVLFSRSGQPVWDYVADTLPAASAGQMLYHGGYFWDLTTDLTGYTTPGRLMVFGGTGWTPSAAPPGAGYYVPQLHQDDTDVHWVQPQAFTVRLANVLVQSDSGGSWPDPEMYSLLTYCPAAGHGAWQFSRVPMVHGSYFVNEGAFGTAYDRESQRSMIQARLDNSTSGYAGRQGTYGFECNTQYGNTGYFDPATHRDARWGTFQGIIPISERFDGYGAGIGAYGSDGPQAMFHAFNGPHKSVTRFQEGDTVGATRLLTLDIRDIPGFQSVIDDAYGGGGFFGVLRFTLHIAAQSGKNDNTAQYYTADLSYTVSFAGTQITGVTVGGYVVGAAYGLNIPGLTFYQAGQYNVALEAATLNTYIADGMFWSVNVEANGFIRPFWLTKDTAGTPWV